MASSSTVTKSSSSRARMSKVMAPGSTPPAVPSLKVGPEGRSRIRPASSEWCITADAAGEQPMMRVDGDSALMMPATPDASPPPPTAT